MKLATLAQTAPESPRLSTWFRDFLKEELTPYPGRAALVARMVIAATIMMVITMTFQVPYGAYGAIYALNISRESPQVTVKTVQTIVIMFVVGAVYILLCAWLFVGDPLSRVLWIIGTLFASFYAISAMTNYGAASRFGYLIVITIPLWDQQIPSELKVEGTLWAVWAITIASVVTVVCEVVFAAIRPGDDLVRSIAERLASVEEILTCYASARPVGETAEKKVTRLAMRGTSTMRTNLRRSTSSHQYNEQMSAVVALAGRLVDIAASLTQFKLQVADDDRLRIGALAAGIAAIREDLLSGRVPDLMEFNRESELSGKLPLLREMEKTASLIPGVFYGSVSVGPYLASSSADERRPSIFVADALSNPEHIKFALKGCLAASLCYFFYTAVAWPGLNTSITTCLLTALTTIGSSRQKQILRFAGAIAGGLVGLVGQVFILPNVDSITGFTVFFVLATGAAAWLATSSPRLSYSGFQFAVAFYLINLQEFTIQTSLAVVRDRVAGVLLGLFMMWLVFDGLWGVPAVVAMKRAFISNLRLLAQLTREPLPGAKRPAILHTSSLRERINANFEKVRSLADGVLFEFGHSREQDLAWRNRIRRWQPELRTVFLTRIALLKYRLQLPGFELPEAAHVAQQEFDDRIAELLDGMADRLEEKSPQAGEKAENPIERLQLTLRTCCLEGPQKMSAAELQTFLVLSQNIESLIGALDKEI